MRSMEAVCPAYRDFSIKGGLGPEFLVGFHTLSQFLVHFRVEVFIESRELKY